MAWFICSDTTEEPLGAHGHHDAMEKFREACEGESAALYLTWKVRDEEEVMATYNGEQAEPHGLIVDHTPITGYHFKGKLWCAHHLVGALLAAGELSPAARDMDIEEVLDQLAETYPDIDRDDEDSFTEAEFPKRHRRSMGPVFCEA